MEHSVAAPIFSQNRSTTFQYKTEGDVRFGATKSILYSTNCADFMQAHLFGQVQPTISRRHYCELFSMADQTISLWNLCLVVAVHMQVFKMRTVLVVLVTCLCISNFYFVSRKSIAKICGTHKMSIARCGRAWAVRQLWKFEAYWKWFIAFQEKWCSAW